MPPQVEQEDCGECGVRERACDIPVLGNEGAWGPWGECRRREDAICTPGDRSDGGPCGLCGAREWECFPDCRWYPLPCAGEGVCRPSELQIVPACAEPGYVRVVECTAECQLSPDFGLCQPLATPAEIELAMVLELDGTQGARPQGVFGVAPKLALAEKSIALSPHLTGDRKSTRPRFSPDGRWLAYASDEFLEGAPGLYLLDLTEVVPRRTLVQALATNLALGERIAWVSSPPSLVFNAALERPEQLYLYWLRFVGDDPASDARARVRLNPDGTTVTAFALAPDGRAIAYAFGAELHVVSLPQDGVVAPPAKVHSRDVGGGDAGLFSNPTWSPSGDALVVGVGAARQVLVSVDTSPAGSPALGAGVALSDASNRAVWAPVGNALAYVENGALEVAWLDAALNPTVVTAPLPEGSLEGFEWAPNGRWLIAAQNVQLASTQVSRAFALAVPEPSEAVPSPELGAPMDISMAKALAFSRLAFSGDSTHLVLTVAPDACLFPECGDGICGSAGGETLASCAKDCAATCGDNRCDYGKASEDEVEPGQGMLCPIDCDGQSGRPLASCKGPTVSGLIDLRDPSPELRILPGRANMAFNWSPDATYVAYGMDGRLVIVSTADTTLTAVPQHLSGEYLGDLVWRPTASPSPPPSP